MSEPKQQTTTLYVVMASSGEHADLTEWVCGVFAGLEQAKALVDAQSQAGRAAKIARKEYSERWRRGPANAALHQQWIAENPQPPVIEADSFWIVAAPLGQWGRWESLYNVDIGNG